MEKINKYVIYLLMFILCSFVAFAEQGYTRQNITLWADAIDGITVNYMSGVNANITILYPDSSVLVNNTAMTQTTNGKFYYTFTTNKTGNYYISTLFYNLTQNLGIVSSITYVEEISEMYSAVIIGIIFVISFLMFFGIYLMTRKYQAPVMGSFAEWFKIGDLGFILTVLCFPLVSLLIGVMMKLSEGQTFYSLIETTYIVSIVLNIIFVFFYACFYMFLRNTINGLEQIAKQRKTQR